MGAIADRRIRENERRAWSDEPARAWLRNYSAIISLLARRGKFGTRPPTLAVEIQLHLPSAPIVAGAIRYADDDRYWPLGTSLLDLLIVVRHSVSGLSV